MFEITYDGTTIWERKADGGFPDAKTLKQRVRDRLDSGRDLSHIDRGTGVKGGANVKGFGCRPMTDGREHRG